VQLANGRDIELIGCSERIMCIAVTTSDILRLSRAKMCEYNNVISLNMTSINYIP